MEGLGVGEWIVIGLSVIIGLFFVLGNWFNNQRATDTLRWLRRGLSGWGNVKSIRLSAPSAHGIPWRVEPDDLGGFIRLQGTLMLSRRENLPLWLFQMARGKADTLEITAEVRSGNAKEIYAIRNTQMRSLKASEREKFQSRAVVKRAAGLTVYASHAEQTDLSVSLEELALRYPAILSVSLQPGSPHLTVIARLSPLLREKPENFFHSLQEFIVS